MCGLVHGLVWLVIEIEIEIVWHSLAQLGMAGYGLAWSGTVKHGWVSIWGGAGGIIARLRSGLIA